MEDFRLMVAIKFPHLQKYLQRLNFRTFIHLDFRRTVVDIFQIMLRTSIECDKPEEIPISAFTDMYVYIIEKYLKVKHKGGETFCAEFLRSSFGLLFDTLDKLKKLTPEFCVKFLTHCKDASNLHIDYFFSSLSERNVKLVLDFCVKHRFNAWNIKNGYLLTDWLIAEDTRNYCENIFIKYGFKYQCDWKYCETLLHVFMNQMWVDDVHFCHYIDDETLFDIDMLLYDDDIFRMQQAIELLVALFINENYRNAISLVWRALPNAFITAKELYSILEPFVLERYDLLKSLCDKYEKTVHEICPVPEVSEPRSLKHLSRVQIRKSLIEVHNLNEETIRKLDIPVTCKSYLWLDDF